MRLTRFSDYSLRVLMYLGLRAPERCTIAEIAEHYRISENHLMKVVHGLSQRGYVQSLRGRGGGLRLAKPAAGISVGEVVRATEADTALVECFGQAKEGEGCVITRACALRHALADAQEAFYATLDEVTLADLTRPKARLTKLLEIVD